VDARGGLVRYDATTVSGLYRFSQGSVEVSAAANFVDPLESNLLGGTSTWRAPPRAPASFTRPAAVPLANSLVLLILALLLVEWWRYSLKGVPARRGRPASVRR
jgi:hypothetical protein